MIMLMFMMVFGSMMFGMIMLVMMMVMLVFDFFFDMNWFMDFLFNNFFLLDNCWLVMMMNGFDLGVGVLVVRLFDWNVNDDFLFFGVTDELWNNFVNFTNDFHVRKDKFFLPSVR